MQKFFSPTLLANKTALVTGKKLHVSISFLHIQEVDLELALPLRRASRRWELKLFCWEERIKKFKTQPTASKRHMEQIPLPLAVT
jgi:hypothetical protein